MAAVINLRKARKAVARARADTVSAAQRARHGRTKSEVLRDTLAAERLSRALDGAKTEPLE